MDLVNDKVRISQAAGGRGQVEGGCGRLIDGNGR